MIDFLVGHWIGWLGLEPAKQIVTLIRVLWCISEGHWTTQFQQWFVCDWAVSVMGAFVVHCTHFDTFTVSSTTS